MHSNEFVGEHLILKNVSVLFRFSAIWISFSFELMKTLAKCHWMKLVQENHIKDIGEGKLIREIIYNSLYKIRLMQGGKCIRK